MILSISLFSLLMLQCLKQQKCRIHPSYVFFFNGDLKKKNFNFSFSIARKKSSDLSNTKKEKLDYQMICSSFLLYLLCKQTIKEDQIDLQLFMDLRKKKRHSYLFVLRFFFSIIMNCVVTLVTTILFLFFNIMHRCHVC